METATREKAPLPGEDERFHHPARAGADVPRSGPHHPHPGPAQDGRGKPAQCLDQGRRQDRHHHPRRERPFRGGGQGRHGQEHRCPVPGLHLSPAHGSDPPLLREHDGPVFVIEDGYRFIQEAPWPKASPSRARARTRPSPNGRRPSSPAVWVWPNRPERPPWPACRVRP
jgi:hypothetical protein